MLVQLTEIPSEIERCRKIAKEHDFEYIPQSDAKWWLEDGIYQSAFAFNFPENEFVETSVRKSWSDRYDFLEDHKSTYGVADSVQQIKEFYKEEVEDTENKYFIYVTPVWQELENKGKGGGWRWHKWGRYIGELDPQCEYLDDEDFGDDFEYILVFTIMKIN